MNLVAGCDRVRVMASGNLTEYFSRPKVTVSGVGGSVTKRAW